MNIYMNCTLWTRLQAERDWENSYRGIIKFRSNIYSILFVKYILNLKYEGEFTQMVWASTKLFGVGRAKGENGKVSIFNNFKHFILENKGGGLVHLTHYNSLFLGWATEIFENICVFFFSENGLCICSGTLFFFYNL